MNEEELRALLSYPRRPAARWRTLGPSLLSTMYLLREELMRPIPMASSLSRVEGTTVRVVADGVAKLE
jgi:hypothetical protein